MYALFEGERQISNPFATEKEVWEAALIEGLVTDGRSRTRKVASSCRPSITSNRSMKRRIRAG